MIPLKSSLVFAFLSMALLVGSAFASNSELLYVQEGQNIVTYSVNKTTAVTKKLGTMVTTFDPSLGSQILRSGSHIYVLSFTSSTQESISVYATTSAGVPVATTVQTLAVKPALYGLYIHPNGKFAYAMFMWTNDIGWASDIVLFTINPNTGKLTNTTKAVANFPANGNWLTSIDRLNGAGTKLYTEDDFVGEGHWDGRNYFVSTINPTTGSVGPRVQFWSDDVIDGYSSVFNDSIIVQTYDGSSGNSPQIKIAPTNPTTPPGPNFTCTAAMTTVCGDLVSISLHPSSKYLFVADPTTNEVGILYISAALNKFEPSGASIPGVPLLGPVFSPDGLLVYAVEGTEILVYVFNPHTGLLTARTSIAAPGVVGTMLPVQ